MRYVIISFYNHPSVRFWKFLQTNPYLNNKPGPTLETSFWDLNIVSISFLLLSTHNIHVSVKDGFPHPYPTIPRSWSCNMVLNFEFVNYRPKQNTGSLALAAFHRRTNNKVMIFFSLVE